VTLEVDTYAERERGILTGSRASLSPAAQDGREVWVNSCACCHAGPAGIAGGTRAGRPFEVLAAYAKYDPNFFNQYIRKPKSIMPCAKMEPHPDYTERDLADLIAFMTVDMR
jgi:cytochrome c2